VIGKISAPRGEHVEPLLYYLFGPGRHEEHTDPHIVAGWRHPASLEPALRPDGERDFATLTGLLKQPQAALGERGYPRPVWHCAMRAAPGDRMLSDDEWAAIAHEVMHRTGLSPHGQEDQAVRPAARRPGRRRPCHCRTAVRRRTPGTACAAPPSVPVLNCIIAT